MRPPFLPRSVPSTGVNRRPLRHRGNLREGKELLPVSTELVVDPKEPEAPPVEDPRRPRTPNQPLPGQQAAPPPPGGRIDVEPPRDDTAAASPAPAAPEPRKGMTWRA